LADWDKFGEIPDFSYMVGLAYGNGVWTIAVNERQDTFYWRGYIYTCTASVPTSKNWQITFSEPNTVPSYPIESLMFGNGVFVATDWSSFYNSTDGNSWTTGIGNANGQGGCFVQFTGPSTSEGYYYYTCNGPEGISPVQVSSDGFNFTIILQEGLYEIIGISYAYFNGKNQYIATGADGSLLTSADGHHFTQQAPINRSSGFYWVASMGDSEPTIAVSADDNSIYSYGSSGSHK